MPNYFPPIPVYPKGYDSDYTLYLVYNTSETITTQDNTPWSDEIHIRPVSANTLEIWSNNGYANIEGELFYYDDVDYDINGKVNKLKRCARNLGGSSTKYNPSGSEVRGFVIAEHHNQLVNAIINTENFIGENFSTDITTLDFKIRNLQSLPIIFDDFSCPDVDFTFFIESSDASTGILARYDIVIDGTFTNYRLDFGDGTSTTTSTNGTHRYALGSEIDPVLTISNTKCTLVQTPITRESPKEPTYDTESTTFEIKLPDIPAIPQIFVPDPPQPNTAINIPPIVFPCLDIGPIGPIDIPSVIIIDPPVVLPSTIGFEVLSLPSEIVIDIPNVDIPSEILVFDDLPSVIIFTDPKIPSEIFVYCPVLPSEIFIFHDIPSEILVFDDIPSEILVFDDIPSEILVFDDIPSEILVFDDIPSEILVFDDIPSVILVFDDIPSSISIALPPGGFPPIEVSPPPKIPPIGFGPPPSIPVNWGTPPPCNCTLTVTCAGGSFANNSTAVNEDGFPDIDPIEVQVGDIGIPSEIFLRVPEIPDIRILHDIPAIIRVEVPEIPDIKIIAPDIPIPSEIKIVGYEIPSVIELMSTSLPNAIAIDASSIPSSIKLDLPEEFPMIRIDASGIPDQIQVVGIPSAIELIGAPSEIKLVLPEKPEVELVYKGSPIDVKINLDISRLTGENGNSQCVSIVPCGN